MNWKQTFIFIFVLLFKKPLFKVLDCKIRIPKICLTWKACDALVKTTMKRCGFKMILFLLNSTNEQCNGWSLRSVSLSHTHTCTLVHTHTFLSVCEMTSMPISRCEPVLLCVICIVLIKKERKRKDKIIVEDVNDWMTILK